MVCMALKWFLRVRALDSPPRRCPAAYHGPSAHRGGLHHRACRDGRRARHVAPCARDRRGGGHHRLAHPAHRVCHVYYARGSFACPRCFARGDGQGPRTKVLPPVMRWRVLLPGLVFSCDFSLNKNKRLTRAAARVSSSSRSIDFDQTRAATAVTMIVGAALAHSSARDVTLGNKR